MKRWVLLTVLGFAFAFAAVAFGSTIQGFPVVKAIGNHQSHDLTPPSRIVNVLFQQDLSASAAGYVDQAFPDMTTYSSYIADDFVVPDGQVWEIQQIYFAGTGGALGDLTLGTSLNCFIFTDNAGVPNGDPEAGPWAWTDAWPVADPAIAYGAGNSSATITLDAEPTLIPGTYWLSCYPTMDYAVGGQWFWQTSDAVTAYSAKLINPGGSFGIGTVWADISVLGAVETSMTFTLFGEDVATTTTTTSTTTTTTTTTIPADDDTGDDTVVDDDTSATDDTSITDDTGADDDITDDDVTDDDASDDATDDTSASDDAGGDDDDDSGGCGC